MTLTIETRKMLDMYILTISGLLPLSPRKLRVGMNMKMVFLIINLSGMLDSNFLLHQFLRVNQ